MRSTLDGIYSLQQEHVMIGTKMSNLSIKGPMSMYQAERSRLLDPLGLQRAMARHCSD